MRLTVFVEDGVTQAVAFISIHEIGSKTSTSAACFVMVEPTSLLSFPDDLLLEIMLRAAAIPTWRGIASVALLCSRIHKITTGQWRMACIVPPLDAVRRAKLVPHLRSCRFLTLLIPYRDGLSPSVLSTPISSLVRSCALLTELRLCCPRPCGGEAEHEVEVRTQVLAAIDAAPSLRVLNLRNSHQPANSQMVDQIVRRHGGSLVELAFALGSTTQTTATADDLRRLLAGCPHLCDFQVTLGRGFEGHTVCTLLASHPKLQRVGLDINDLECDALASLLAPSAAAAAAGRGGGVQELELRGSDTASPIVGLLHLPRSLR